MDITHLYIEGTPIGFKESTMLEKFISNKECKLEELELNETEVEVAVVK